MWLLEVVLVVLDLLPCDLAVHVERGFALLDVTLPPWVHVGCTEVLDAVVLLVAVLVGEVDGVCTGGVVGVMPCPDKAVHGVLGCADLPLGGVDAPGGIFGGGFGDEGAGGRVVVEDRTDEDGVEWGGFGHGGLRGLMNR